MISVVIPAYNAEKTIKKTIESVLKQTFTNFEIIIINDGSNDSTLAKIAEIQDERIKVFSFPNAGPVISRNRGLEKVSGKYTSFLDHDDLWSPDKLKAQFEALENNPKAAIAYSWINYIDEYDQILRSGLRINVNGNALPQLLLTNFLETASNPLISTQALRDLGGFDKSTEPSDDRDLYLRLAAHYHFVCVPRPQILYRLSVNSLSTNIDRMEKAGVKVITKAFNQVPQELQYLKSQSLANLYMYLTLKSLEGEPKPKKSLLSIKLLTRALQYQPQIVWKRQKLVSIAILKSIIGIILPSQQAQSFWNKLKQLNKK